MDRKIEKVRWPLARIVTFVIGGGMLLLLVLGFLAKASSSTYRVDPQKILIDTVRSGMFTESVMVDGTVIPNKTIIINAAEGGRVEECFVEDGAIVKKGDAILRLSNTDLQLDFMNKEVSFLDQMNNMRNTRLSLEQSMLHLSSQHLDIRHLYEEKKNEYSRMKKLKESESVSVAEFEKVENEYNYLSAKCKLLSQTIKKDSIFKKIQTDQMEKNIALIERNRQMVKMSLDNLIVRAPMNGQLTALNAELGDNKLQGEKLGQVDDLEGFKIHANMSELYISQVYIGQEAICNIDGQEFKLAVKKIYPNVSAGMFQVDIAFEGNDVGNLKQGQSVRVKLGLSEKKRALLVRKGGFFQKTGGQWIYVVDGTGAVRRPVKIARQNSAFYEITEGLSEGEKVIISGYDNFGEAEQLVFK